MSATSLKNKTVFVCSECGYESPKWMGRCPDCGNWNTLTEEIKSISNSSKYNNANNNFGIAQAVACINDISVDENIRIHSGMEEFDRVLGGGIVPGSIILVCGDPGIGKSTILLQLSGSIDSRKILYVSGEESLRQVKLRSNRLGINNPNLFLSSTTQVENICETIKNQQPGLVIIDSIQTMMISGISSSCGSVTQVRESAQMLISVCKSNEIPVFIVGHVNKDGGIAGPRVLEHMVDTVLYFEGEKNNSYRILRAIKNRFGSTNEIGVFEMNGNGLTEVRNPSEMLLSQRNNDISGTCITCLLEGTRPLLIEVQALLTKTNFGNPKRISTGFDYNRTSLIIAILEKRIGYFLGNLDIYVNIAGGLRVDDPSADLSIAVSMISNLLDKPIPSNTMVLGELGLTGEIRFVPQIQKRIGEATRLGFTRIIVPKACEKQININEYSNTKIVFVSNLSLALKELELGR